METLPIETIHDILLQSKYDDVMRLCQTNSLYKDICKNEYFWKQYLWKHYLPNVDQAFIDKLTLDRRTYHQYVKYIREILKNTLEKQFFFTSRAVEAIILSYSKIDGKILYQTCELNDYDVRLVLSIDEYLIRYFSTGYHSQSIVGLYQLPKYYTSCKVEEMIGDIADIILESIPDFDVDFDVESPPVTSYKHNTPKIFSPNAIIFIREAMNYINVPSQIVTLDDIFTIKYDPDKADGLLVYGPSMYGLTDYIYTRYVDSNNELTVINLITSLLT